MTAQAYSSAPAVGPAETDTDPLHIIVPPLPFPLSSGIISVCLDLAGHFRNKDTHLC